MGGGGGRSPLRESDLFTLWLEQRFPAGVLSTVRGEPVRVLYRGRPGHGPGPDFRDARVSVGGAAPRLGDVELHVSAADFQRHGHAVDPAYAHVVLHVVFDADGARETALPGGRSAPLLALRPWVERRTEEIAAWLQRVEPWREPCHTAVERLGPGQVRDVLDDGGERRLRRKAGELAAKLVGGAPGEVLYRALCGALGLTRNVQPFHVLAERVPLTSLADDLAVVDAGEATRRVRVRLLAAAGFGPTAPALGSLNWRLERLRPNAHPAKRVEALAALLVKHHVEGLEPALRAAAGAGPAALLQALRVPGIGRGRAVELTVNAVLPFLVATGAEEQAMSLAATLPAADAYGALSTLDGALLAEGVSLARGAVLAQQGALALHDGWCRRGGCGVCPLS